MIDPQVRNCKTRASGWYPFFLLSPYASGSFD
jgi:hypothetical protein